MSIDSINGSNASNSSAAISNAIPKKGADQETFLKLLVAQLKHQDPLNPQDGTQFVAQLAQFTSLEQLTSINQKIGQLVGTDKK